MELVSVHLPGDHRKEQRRFRGGLGMAEADK